MIYNPSTPKNYLSPLPAGQFTFVAPNVVYPEFVPSNLAPSYILKVRFNGTLLYSGSSSFTTNLLPGTYTVFYGLAMYSHIGGGNNTYDVNTVTYTFPVVENRLPLKKWTCTEVINRLLDLAEPIRKGEKPRFRLQGMNDDGTKEAGSQAALFDNILSPEFAFTKQTLRECLRQVGEVLHGEPRFTPKKGRTRT